MGGLFRLTDALGLHTQRNEESNMRALEAQMWATLKKCGKTRMGCHLNTSDGLTAMLIELNLLKPRIGGLVALTKDGRALLKLMPMKAARRCPKHSEHGRSDHETLH